MRWKILEDEDLNLSRIRIRTWIRIRNEGKWSPSLNQFSGISVVMSFLNFEIHQKLPEKRLFESYLPQKLSLLYHFFARILYKVDHKRCKSCRLPYCKIVKSDQSDQQRRRFLWYFCILPHVNYKCCNLYVLQIC